MIVIKFGKWSEYGAKQFTYTRIYTKNGKWTPFCKMKIRFYSDWIVEQLEEEQDNAGRLSGYFYNHNTYETCGYMEGLGKAIEIVKGGLDESRNDSTSR